MGRGSNRLTTKVVQRQGQRRKKARLKRRAEATRALRLESKKKAKSQTVVAVSS